MMDQLRKFVVIPYYLSLRYNASTSLPGHIVVVIPYYLSLRYNPQHVAQCALAGAGCNSLLSLAKV